MQDKKRDVRLSDQVCAKLHCWQPQASIAAETPDGNDASSDTSRLPIPSPELSMDLGSEGHEHGHDKDATNALQSPQEQGLAAENPRKRPAATPNYPGKSERTLSRQRLAQTKLAAQGFTTLPEFFQQKAEKEKQEARLRVAALVAAATATVRSRSMQHRPYVLEEEEVSGDKTTAEEGHPKTTSASHIHKHTLKTSATGGMAHPRGLDCYGPPQDTYLIGYGYVGKRYLVMDS